jgi:hypothetical protein
MNWDEKSTEQLDIGERYVHFIIYIFLVVIRKFLEWAVIEEDGTNRKFKVNIGIEI